MILLNKDEVKASLARRLKEKRLEEKMDFNGDAFWAMPQTDLEGWDGGGQEQPTESCRRND